MKKSLIKIFVLLAILLFASSFGVVPVTHAEPTLAKECTMAFIENALPVDLTKYNVTLKHDSTLGSAENLVYVLASNESTLNVNCKVQNNVLMSCHLTVKEGQVISDRQYASLTAAVKSFLEKYQNYAKTDSSNMISMLDNVDVTKNSSTIIDNAKFTITNINIYGVERTSFRWIYTAGGADYTSLQLAFEKDGSFVALRDDRNVYTIGDTSVNITDEQAIDIAMKYIETYSYNMPDDSVITGFNITQDRSTAKLVAVPINSTVLRPYWHVEVYLNQTCPGSVQGFDIYVWANSGELFLCSNKAYGGVEPVGDADFEFTSSPEENNIPSTPNEGIFSSLDVGFAVGVTVAVVAVIGLSAVIVRKRKK